MCVCLSNVYWYLINKYVGCLSLKCAEKEYVCHCCVRLNFIFFCKWCELWLNRYIEVNSNYGNVLAVILNQVNRKKNKLVKMPLFKCRDSSPAKKYHVPIVSYAFYWSNKHLLTLVLVSRCHTQLCECLINKLVPVPKPNSYSLHFDLWN